MMAGGAGTRRFTTRAGRTLDFTQLGFGGAPLGNFLQKLDEAACDAAVEAAWSAGMRHFDTAPLYGLGLSERRLGRVLRTKPRDGFVLSSKVGRVIEPAGPGEGNGGIYVDLPPLKFRYDYSYSGVMRSFQDSLERLGVDRVDILYVHDVDGPNHGGRAGADARIDELLATGGWTALQELRDGGAVAAIGIGVNEWQPCLSMLERADPDLFLLAGRYTLLEQAPLTTLFPHCARAGVGVVIGGPYNSGVLAGKTTFDYAAVPPDIAKRAEALRVACAAHGVDLRAAALRFVLAHERVVSVIPGAISAREAQENAALAIAPIPPALWRDLKVQGLIDRDAPVPESGTC